MKSLWLEGENFDVFPNHIHRYKCSIWGFKVLLGNGEQIRTEIVGVCVL